MSEGKLYEVKNDEGEYWDFKDLDGFWGLYDVSRPTTVSEENAKATAHSHGGHVVTFVEEPKKAVLTKEQAKIVEGARITGSPATYICASSALDDEKLLIQALENGYTVEKEKKYNVKVPYAVNSYYKKIDHIRCIAGDKFTVDLDEDLAHFTESEIEHYGLQDCEKEEVTDDGMGC